MSFDRGAAIGDAYKRRNACRCTDAHASGLRLNKLEKPLMPTSRRPSRAVTDTPATQQSATERSVDLERVFVLFVRGATQSKMAQELGLSRAQVAAAMREIKQSWLVEDDDVRGEGLALALAKIDY